MDQAVSTKERLSAFCVITVIAAALATLVHTYNIFEGFENHSWDIRQRYLTSESEADSRIKIIVLDQQSLDYFANEEFFYWPLPRPFYGQVVEFLRRAGARGIAFDMLFTEYSSYGKDHDLAFVEMLQGDMPVISAVDGNYSGIPIHQEELESFQKRKERNLLDGIGKQISNKMPDFSSATFPFKELLEQSPFIANVYGAPDEDGLFRHYVPFGRIAGKTILSLPFSLYLATGHKLNFEKLQDQLDENGALTIRFHGKDRAYQQIPFANVVSAMAALESGDTPKIPLDFFKDSWVFLGPTAAGLKDDRPTPTARSFKGVVYNATVLDNLINDGFISKLPFYAVLFLIALSSAVSALSILFLSRGIYQILSLSVLLIMILASSVQGFLLGWWVPLIVPIFAGMTATVFAGAFLYQREGRARRFIKSAFSLYLSPVVIQQMVNNPSKLALGGEKRELTILFSDIAGFTSFSEDLEPTALVSLLNTYLSALTDIILESGGTLDKYEGDAIIAFWNAPLEFSDHAKRAVQAALRCQEKIAELKEYFEKTYSVYPKTRIGLNSGVASVGNFGSTNRFNYTVIGNAANLAARLESLNKVFQTPIMTSLRTVTLCEEAHLFRSVAWVKVAGVREPVQVFEPIMGRPTHYELETFELAYKLFCEGERKEAGELFKKCSGDHLAKMYLRRIEIESKNEDFDPVWDFSDKRTVEEFGG